MAAKLNPRSKAKLKPKAGARGKAEPKAKAGPAMGTNAKLAIGGCVLVLLAVGAVFAFRSDPSTGTKKAGSGKTEPSAADESKSKAVSAESKTSGAGDFKLPPAEKPIGPEGVQLGETERPNLVEMMLGPAGKEKAGEAFDKAAKARDAYDKAAEADKEKLRGEALAATQDYYRAVLGQLTPTQYKRYQLARDITLDYEKRRKALFPANPSEDDAAKQREKEKPLQQWYMQAVQDALGGRTPAAAPDLGKK